jgi:hypothetical protein
MTKSVVGWLMWFIAVAVVSVFLFAADEFHKQLPKTGSCLLPGGPPLNNYWLD